MTNGEKFTTAHIRREAYRMYVHQNWDVVGEFAWLELEYEEELKPCPFCGSEARIVDLGDNQFKYYQVCCTKCKCKMDAHIGKHNAIAAWNRRV